MNTIASNIAAGQWGVAEKNIESLEKTIRNELRTRPVAVASNPVQIRLDAVKARIKELRDVYSAFNDALTKAQKLAKNARQDALNSIAAELYAKVSTVVAKLLTVQSVLGGPLVIWSGTNASNMDVIKAELGQLKTAGSMVKYLARQRNSLTPAIHETLTERTHLLALNRKFTKVLSEFGLRPGGPPVQPTGKPKPSPAPSSSGHPKVGGQWFEASGDCTGGRITITQDAGGNVSSVTDDVTPCGGAWASTSVHWTAPNVLSFEYSITKNPGWWIPGRYTITFNDQGTSATATWTASDNSSGSLTWSRG